jgi:hypothetical protein
MFQPFERFKLEYIDRLIRMNKIYIVSQSYNKAFDHFEDPKEPILFTDYDQLGLAQIHFSAVKYDKYAALINLKNPRHKLKVTEMLSDDSEYEIYWAIVKSVDEIKKRMSLKYTSNIRRYIQKNTSWRIGSDETVKPSLQIVYGELFIILKRAKQTLRVKFDEIENA